MATPSRRCCCSTTTPDRGSLRPVLRRASCRTPMTAEVGLVRRQRTGPRVDERLGLQRERAVGAAAASPPAARTVTRTCPGVPARRTNRPSAACGPRATVMVPPAVRGMRVRGEEGGRHRHRAEQTLRPAADRPRACAQAAPRARRWAVRPQPPSPAWTGSPPTFRENVTGARSAHPARRGTPLARRPPVPPGVLRQAGIRECRTPSRRSAAATAPAPARQAPRPTSTMVDQDVPSSAGAGRAGTDTRVVVVAGP